MVRWCKHGLWIALVLAVTTTAYAGVWTVHKPLEVPQNDPGFTEVIPAEDMDGVHTIATGGTALFWPSYNTVPQAGDNRCFLYDLPTGSSWWQSTFLQPSTSIQIQFIDSDTNDGWADIYVDGVLEFSVNTYYATSIDTVVCGTQLPYTTHTIEILTRPNGGDVSLDYVAHPCNLPRDVIPEPAGLGLLGMALLACRRRRG